MIFLFTDFGTADIYVGQVKAVLQQRAPGVPVVDLLNDAPNFDIAASAHLLAALAPRIPTGSVTLAVVDPGVGGARRAVAAAIDNRWFVGPDNGLMSVLAARTGGCVCRRIHWRPEGLSTSFHGRDLFAPIAAEIARGEFPAAKVETVAGLEVRLPADDFARAIYVDHYGNVCTGLRATQVAAGARLSVRGRELRYERAFSDAPPGELFWYANSLGLIEIAGNACSAAEKLDLRVGTPIEIRP